MLNKKAKLDSALFLRLVGATFSALGFYFVAFNKQLTGAILIGLDGVLMALGGSWQILCCIQN